VLPVLEDIVGMKHFNAKSGKSKSLFEIELCEFIAKYPDKCSKLVKSPVEIIRNAIGKYKDAQDGQVGLLWNYLASFFEG
jgi:hypothetical protein